MRIRVFPTETYTTEIFSSTTNNKVLPGVAQVGSWRIGGINYNVQNTVFFPQVSDVIGAYTEYFELVSDVFLNIYIANGTRNEPISIPYMYRSGSEKIIHGANLLYPNEIGWYTIVYSQPDFLGDVISWYQQFDITAHPTSWQTKYTTDTRVTLGTGDKLLYLDFTIRLKPPSITSPLGGYIDVTQPNKFAWSAPVFQDQATIIFYQRGQVAHTATVGASERSYTLPANTLTANEVIQWAVQIIDWDGYPSPLSDIASLTSIPVVPDAPDLITPVNVLIADTQPIIFQWVYRSSDGSKQGSAHMEVSSDQGETWTPYNIESQQDTITLPSGSLTSGTHLWRVYTTNTNGNAGPTSTVAKFQIYGRPAAPIITSITDGSAKPTITWGSTGQVAYELQIIHNGEVVYNHYAAGNEREHTVTDFLEDGVYTVQVRITGNYGLNSEWAEASITIVTVKPPAPVAFVAEYNACNRIIADVDEATVVQALVYRVRLDPAHTDGLFDDTMEVLVYQTTDTHIVFDDYAAASGVRYKYIVRAVTADNAFMDSLGIVGMHHVRGSVFSLAESPGEYRVNIIHNLGGPVERKSIMSVDGAGIRYEGRTLPVFEYAEYEANEWSLSAVLETQEQIEILKALVRQRKPILYIDQHGRKMYISITHISLQPDRKHVRCEIPFVEVDYHE